MKKWIAILVIVLSGWTRGEAQSEELQQLMLNIEKLSQFKQMLSDLKKAYTILYNGYHRIEGIAKGNFQLHQGYLDGLLQISPAVQRYERIARIIELQSKLLKTATSSYTQLQAQGGLRPADIAYIAEVYARLGKDSLHQLELLVQVLTAGTYRMSDAERLRSIDGVYDALSSQWVFLQSFGTNALVLAQQRRQARGELQREKNWFNIP
jgi:DNA repair ATPase RecN